MKTFKPGYLLASVKTKARMQIFPTLLFYKYKKKFCLPILLGMEVKHKLVRLRFLPEALVTMVRNGQKEAWSGQGLHMTPRKPL